MSTSVDDVAALRAELLDLLDVVKTLRYCAVADAPLTCRRAEDLGLAVVRQLDRIAARTPQRATDTMGVYLWIHTCGTVTSGTDASADYCRECGQSGAWMQLYTVPDGAA